MSEPLHLHDLHAIFTHVATLSWKAGAQLMNETVACCDRGQEGREETVKYCFLLTDKTPEELMDMASAPDLIYLRIYEMNVEQTSVNRHHGLYAIDIKGQQVYTCAKYLKALH